MNYPDQHAINALILGSNTLNDNQDRRQGIRRERYQNATNGGEIRKSMGINAKFPSENAPDFVVAKIGIHVDDFKKWLADQDTNEAGWLNLEIKRKLDDRERLSVTVDNWKPNRKPDAQPDQDDELEEIPF